MIPVGQSANQLPALPDQNLGHIWAGQRKPLAGAFHVLWGLTWGGTEGFNERAGCRTGPSQHNLAVCNWCCASFHWMSES